MEDDAIELVDKIKAKISKSNSGWANAIYDYYTLNEFNGIFMFQSELEDKKECYLLDHIALQFKLKEYEIDWIYNTIYEIVFGYKPEQEEQNDDNSNDIKQQQTYITNNNDSNIILPSELDWNLSNYQQSKCNTFLARTFPRLHQSTQYGDSGNSLFTILAVGYKHNIDLVALILDIFNEYRINEYIQSNGNKYVKFKAFINKCVYFKNLNYKIRQKYITGLTYYMRKFQHILLFNPLNQINDAYIPFVQYTFALTLAINKLQNIFKTGVGCPLQIDFWIIPNHVISVPDATITYLGDDLFDYIDDDAEENNGEFLDELNAADNDDNDQEIGRIEQRLDHAKIKYIKEIIHHNQHKNSIAAKILNAVKFICQNKYNNKRIIIIIDRRHSSTKINRASDIMYVYQPPKPYGNINNNNVNDDRYCYQSMNNLSLSYILPKLIYEQRANHISCMDDLKGRMFLLSFHIYSWKKIRCYQYFQTGVCTRFKTKYLYQIWPLLFFKDIYGNQHQFKKINQKIVDKEFKIPLNDEIFEIWYPKITGKFLRK